MKYLVSLMFAVALLGGTSTGTWAQQSAADCEALWTKADANTDGTLKGDEAKPYLDKMTAANAKTADPTAVTKDEFMPECQKGTFAGM